MQDVTQRIAAFLAGSPFAVVGASTNRAKFGNKVLRCYLRNGREVYPINPRADVIEDVPCFGDLAATPKKPHGVSIITPGKITEQTIERMGELGIAHVWMQPGAESDRAIARAEALGMNVIAGGPCVLVELGCHDDE